MNIKQLWEIVLHFFFPVSCEKCGKPGKSLCDECKALAAREERIKKLIDEAVSRALEKAIPEIVERVIQELGAQKTDTQKPEISLQPKDDDYISLMFEDTPITKHINNLTVYSAAVYYSQIKALIHDFKFSGKKFLCASLGRAMGKFFPKPEADYIIPVPLHLDSDRGYNQAAELAKGIAEIWGLNVLEAVQWSQVIPKRLGLTGRERMQLTPDAFRVIDDVKGLRVVIIDDVCTTGSTLSCLAESLKQAGAVVVCAYSLAMVSV